MERGGPVRHRQRVAGAEERRKGALELRDARPHAPPAGPECLVDGVCHLVGDGQVGQRDRYFFDHLRGSASGAIELRGCFGSYRAYSGLTKLVGHAITTNCTTRESGNTGPRSSRTSLSAGLRSAFGSTVAGGMYDRGDGQGQLGRVATIWGRDGFCGAR